MSIIVTNADFRETYEAVIGAARVLFKRETPPESTSEPIGFFRLECEGDGEEAIPPSLSTTGE